MNVTHIVPGRHVVRLGDRGRIVLPADVRRALGIEEGQELILIVQPGQAEVRVTTRAEIARRGAGMLPLPPQRSLVDELIAERRAEPGQE